LSISARKRHCAQKCEAARIRGKLKDLHYRSADILGQTSGPAPSSLGLKKSLKSELSQKTVRPEQDSWLSDPDRFPPNFSKEPELRLQGAPVQSLLSSGAPSADEQELPSSHSFI
jgi:hypothetical protein